MLHGMKETKSWGPKSKRKSKGTIRGIKKVT